MTPRLIVEAELPESQQRYAMIEIRDPSFKNPTVYCNHTIEEALADHRMKKESATNSFDSSLQR